MRSLALSSSILSLACMLVSPIAWAAEAFADPPASPGPLDPLDQGVDAPAAPAAPARPFFVGASAGVGWPSVTHPELLTSSFTSATLGLHAGYTLNPLVALGFELTTLEKSVAKEKEGGLFVPASAVQPQADCTTCTEPVSGGEVMQVTAVFGTLGPRVDLTPFGPDGLYVGASGGLAFVIGLEGRTGLGGTARAGFRLRAAEVITVSLEGGLQGQTFADASVVMPYVAATLRPYF